MHSWRGITLDQSYDSGGALSAVNVRFYTEGELQRRNGQSQSVAIAGNVLMNYRHPSTGYWVATVTSGGNIQVESL